MVKKQDFENGDEEYFVDKDKILEWMDEVGLDETGDAREFSDEQFESFKALAKELGLSARELLMRVGDLLIIKHMQQ